MLTPDLASRFARLTLGHLGREWPYKLDQVLSGPHDLATPAERHPIFHGSFDWHSCVHGWWQVLRLARRFPDLPERAEIDARADAMLVPEKVAGEVAVFERPFASTFERPYGWGWLLALHDETSHWPERGWGEALEPLARLIATRLADYLPRLVYPVRHGVHSNTAFALVHARRWAQRHDRALAGLIEARARDWFGGDRAVRPIEPSGEDFLSPTLCVALLMAKVLPASEFADWFAAYLPDAGGLATPARVSDRSDGRLAHLDGLNLSRAWCWRRIGEVVPGAVPAELAAAHLDAAMPHLADDYMGEHWLASFALLALDDG